MLSPSRQALPAAQHSVAYLWYRAALPVAPRNIAWHSAHDMRLCPIKALCPGRHCLNETEVRREILFTCSGRNSDQIQLCSGSRGFSSLLTGLSVLCLLPSPVTVTCWWSRSSWQLMISPIVHLHSPSGPSSALEISSYNTYL